MEKTVDRHRVFEKKADERKREFDLELSGQKSGYMYRTSATGSEAGNDGQTENRRNKAKRPLTALEIALSDPAYAALYNDTLTLIQEAARRAEANLTVAERAVANREEELEQLLDRAAKLHPSGQPVFRDRNGNAVTQDGHRLSATDAASIVWPDNAPSYENYRDRVEALEAARAAEASWQDYANTVGEAQDRLADEDNPPSAREMREIQDRIEAARPELPSSEPIVPEQQTAAQNFASSIPDLS